MPGFGFGTSRAARRRTGGGIVLSPAIFTMTQLALGNRVYQRGTDAGGGQGKGQGAIPVTLNVTGAGSIYARISSGGVTRGDLQAPWLVMGAAAVANGPVSISGIDARLGWFYLDLSGDGVTWQNGTVPVGMGRLIALAGQSLQVRMFTKINDATTLASMGISIPANGRIFASWSDAVSNTASSWMAITDVAQANNAANTAGGAELLNLQIAASGVNCGLIGNAVGATAISTWLPGQANYVTLQNVIAGAGGAFEAFFWFQGHSDAASGINSYSGYKANLSTLFAAIAGLSSRGFARYLSAIPNINSASWGNFSQRAQIRKAAADWCAENGATYLGFADLEMIADNIHQNQAGARRTARHLHRATRPEFALAVGDQGPVVTGASKSGVTVTLPVSLAPNATALTSAGAPATRFVVARANDMAGTPLALDAVTPITLGANTITLKLASDPGNIPLEIWPYGAHPVADGSASGVYDNSNDSDGLAQGRQLFADTVPVRVRANTTLTAFGAAYGAARFGTGLTGGRLQSPYSGLLGMPYAGFTVDLWARVNSLPPGNQVFFGQLSGMFVGINASGALLYQAGNETMVTLAGQFSAGNNYHIRASLMPGGRRMLIFLNGVLVADHAVAASVNFLIDHPFAIGDLGGQSLYQYTSGWVDEVAIFAAVPDTANFTPPDAPWLGDEADLLHLWHLDGNSVDSAA